MITPSALRVLIVQSDAGTRRTLRARFEQRGHQVEEATTCQQAIEQIMRNADKTPYRLAIVERRLPDGLGHAVIKTMKQMTPEATCLMIDENEGPAPTSESSDAVLAEYRMRPLTTRQLLGLMDQGGCLG